MVFVCDSLISPFAKTIQLVKIERESRKQKVEGRMMKIKNQESKREITDSRLKIEDWGWEIADSRLLIPDCGEKNQESKKKITDFRLKIEDRGEKNQESRTKNQDFTLLSRLVSLCIVVFLLTGFFSCQPKSSKKTTKQTITDGTGRVVEISQSPQTVMALSPAMTELLFELVNKERIVGRTDQCDYPEVCLSLPKVQVYPTVNLEKVLKINPDLIISNSEITPPETAEKLTQLGIPVLLYEINSIEKFYTTVKAVAKILGVEEKGKVLIANYELRITTLKSQVSDSKSQVSKSAITLVSIDPIYIHGKTSFLNELLEIAGFQNAADSAMGSYPQVSRNWLLRANPDYILGQNFEALDTTFFELYPELRSMKAYQQKNIYPLDGDLASRPGPRFVELIEEMCKIKNRNLRGF